MCCSGRKGDRDMAITDIDIRLDKNDLIQVKKHRGDWGEGSGDLVISIGTLPTATNIQIDMDAANDLLDQLQGFVFRKVE